MVRLMAATEDPKQILIVDRDVAAVEPLRQKLAEAGFVVRAITDGSAAAAAVAEHPPHLLIIEWNVPGLAALEVIQKLRQKGPGHDIRLIILSNLSGEEHVVTGLNIGADDYITKPFSLRETVARACALLRCHSQQPEHQALCRDDLVLDASTNRVMAQGKLVPLRGVEYRLLQFLMSHSGRTFNRTQLLSRVWGDDTEVDERTVDVNVQRLRKILSERGYESYIQTVRGFGYRFAPPAMRE
jgi:two-component system, OmpR family, phosphate regulon response regulator PhoB